MLKNYSTRRLLNFSWIGPLIFFTVIILAGMWYPGYSHINQHVSELGAMSAPTRFLMNWVGIIPFGICIMLFSIGGMRVSKGDSLSYLAFLALFLAGIAFVAVGLYPVDDTYVSGAMSPSTRKHALAAMGAFLGIVGAMFLTGLKVFTSERSAFHVVSVLMCLFAIWIMFVKNTLTTEDPNRGFLQRLYFVNACVWMIIASIVAKRRLQQK